MKAAGEKSKASQVRAALFDGPKARETIHKLVPAVHRSAINSALLDMQNCGAVDLHDGLYRMHYAIRKEADYHAFMRAARGARIADPVTDTGRSAIERGRVVDGAMMAWR